MAEGMSVHVIDDDEGIRRMLAYVLGSAGFGPRLYASAEAFLREAATGGGPAGVLTDVRLPGMSGLDLVRRLKAEGDAGPVIVMSGVADIDMAVEAMKLGAVDFLQKPFRPATVVAVLREAVEQEGRRGL
ncbi:MAG: fixJ, partial [Phenylobacterium sp.]|nr:fixJ [Phenylobacterium sp.]